MSKRYFGYEDLLRVAAATRLVESGEAKARQELKALWVLDTIADDEPTGGVELVMRIAESNLRDAAEKLVQAADLVLQMRQGHKVKL